jgi:surface antigen Omp85-like protein/surface antigen-like variable number repeat protein
MSRTLAVLVCALTWASVALAQAPPVPAVPFRQLVTEGVSVFSPTEITWTLHLEEQAPLPASPDDLAARLRSRYEREGYTKASVRGSFDQTGRLTFRVDEGRIDAVVFEGVDQRLGEELTGSFSIRPGDLFNDRHVSTALRKVLAPTGGAIRAGGYDLVDRGGRRTLVVSVRRRSADVDATFGTESREDWYSPADGLNLALGFGATLFDQRRFAHTYLQGYVSYKFAREAVGYNLAFERPILGGPDAPRLLATAELHDATASDDFWRLSIAEQSLVSLTFKNSFRDYYNARGYQVGASYQPDEHNELRFSWRADRHEALQNTADYALFRGDEPFRPNRRAADGKLRSFVIGYTLDSRGFGDEDGRRRLARHTGFDLFGASAGVRPGYRVDWTTEIARTGLGGDFSFTRHVANARAYVPMSGAQEVRGRLLVGASTGALPPQRLFALGGIGSVHGYAFKESAGTGMVLGNLEYFLGSSRRAYLVGFLDVGHIADPLPGNARWLKGIGVGGGFGDLRIDFGWRANDIPKSLQVLVRFGPTF